MTATRAGFTTARRRGGGQALVELIICAALVIALVPGMVVLFKYAQTRQFADELVRYAVWERTVWADPGHKWNNEAQGKDQLVQAGSVLIAARGIARLSNPRQSLSSARAPADAIEGPVGGRLKPWDISKRTQTLLRLSDAKAGSLTGTTEISPSVLSEKWDAVDNQLPAHVVAGSFEMPVLRTDMGLELNSDTLVTASLSVPLKNLYGEWQGLFPIPDHALGEGVGAAIQLDARGAILANAWTPKNEGVFCKKVHGLDLKEQLTFMTYINAAVDDLTSFIPDIAKHMIPFLGAFTQAGNPELHASTSVLPYIRTVPWEIEGESGMDGFGDKPGGANLNAGEYEVCS